MRYFQTFVVICIFLCVNCLFIYLLVFLGRHDLKSWARKVIRNPCAYNPNDIHLSCAIQETLQNENQRIWLYDRDNHLF